METNGWHKVQCRWCKSVKTARTISKEKDEGDNDICERTELGKSSGTL